MRRFGPGADAVEVEGRGLNTIALLRDDVYGLVFSVWFSGCRDWRLATCCCVSCVSGVECRVWGAGCGVEGVGCRV